MSQRRVVVTGMGVIAPNAIGVEDFLEALSEGKSGIKPIKSFDVSKYPTQYAGEVEDFNPLSFLHPKSARRLDRFSQFGLASAKMALEDSKLNLETLDRSRIGVLMGSAVGGQGWAFDQFLILREHGYTRLNPFTTAATFPNALSSAISIEFNLKGTSETISSGCASSSLAIGHGYDFVRNGALDIAFCGGAEAMIQEPIFAAFCRSRVFSESNHDPNPKPFDLNRDGTLLGEGGACLILESLDHALLRGAKIYGEILSWHSNCDAYHPIAHEASGRSIADCILEALKRASLSPRDIYWIKAHGVGDKDLDLIETKAYKLAFQDDSKKIPITSIKSMIGHTQGASGAIEAVAAFLSIHSSTAFPTINYQTPDPECDLDYIPNKPRTIKGYRYALNLITGFGGKNVAMVVGKYEG